MKKIFLTFICGSLCAGQIYGQFLESADTTEFYSDTLIRQRVNNRLRSGSFLRKFATVTFDVDRGFVALTGYVETEDEKNEVEAAMREIPGVKGVKNDIKTREQPSKFINPLYPY